MYAWLNYNVMGLLSSRCPKCRYTVLRRWTELGRIAEVQHKFFM
jgi:hypothetical protein